MDDSRLFQRLDDSAYLASVQADEQLIQKLCACVRSGDPAEMEALVWQTGGVAGHMDFGATPLRHMQNLVIMLTHSLKTAALQGGAGHIRCSQMEEQFVHRVEACRTVDQVRTLANEIKRQFCHLVHGSKQVEFQDPALQKAAVYIADHCTDKLSLSRVASEVGLSREHFCRKFHAQAGMPLSRYIQQVKIRCAKKMLEDTDASLAEIAAYLSFSSQSYFHKVFTRLTGSTPGAYRRRR